MFNGSLNSLNQRTRFTKWFETGSNRVLMYHSIGGGLYDNIPPTQLYRQLKQLDSAFEIVDLPAIADDTTSEKKIALTFDDGFSDFYTQALPVLEDLGVPATVFVMERTFEDPAFVHDPGHDYDYMSEKQVSEVAQHELVSIGNHTMTHPDLTELETHELEEEISDTNNRLEDRFDVTINRFAYPYNNFNRQAAEIVRQSHSLAVCGGPRTQMITAHTDRCALPRLNGAVDNSLLQMTVTDFSSNFGGLYSAFRRNVEAIW